MSLTLPIEDLSRLKVSAQLSKTGQPVLSLTMKPSSPRENDISGPSGVHVSFERVIENGCWSLAMTTHFERTGSQSLPLDSLSSISYDTLGMRGTSGGPAADWGTNSVAPPIIALLHEGAGFSVSSNLADIFGSPGPLDTPPGSTSFLEWIQPNEGDYMRTEQDLAVAFTPSKPAPHQLPPQTLFSPSSNSSPDPAGHPDSMPSGSTSSRQEDDDSDSSSASLRPSGQKRFRRLSCLNASCNKKFMSEHTRQTHMKSHQHKLRRSFPCTMGCSEQFSRQHDRFRHEVTKHGYQSKWTCDKCHGFFSSEKSLGSHKCSSSGRWRIIPATLNGLAHAELQIS